MRLAALGLALLLAACCPVPAGPPGSGLVLETADTGFVGTVTSLGDGGAWLEPASGPEVFVVTDAVLAPGERVYVAGELGPEGVRATSVRSLAAPR